MKASQILKNGIAALPQVLWNLTLIALGSALCAVALNGILIPRQFLSGGFTGLSLIIHYLFPAFPLGAIYFLLNIPNYAFGWKYVGRRFFLYSIAGMIIFSAAIEAIHISLPVYDYLLSALLAGVIVGIGSGLILKSLGSAGGTDILSVILLKLFSIRLGTTILAFNVIILAAAAALFTLRASRSCVVRTSTSPSAPGEVARPARSTVPTCPSTRGRSSPSSASPAAARPR